MKVYKDLPKFLGKGYENAVKMTMELTPITRFCKAQQRILLSISGTLVHHVTEMLDELEKTKLKSNALLISESVNNYQPLKNVITTLVNNLGIYILEVKAQLQKILPEIKGGGEHSSEKDLVAIFTKYRKSPFFRETVGAFLKTRKREITLIDFILNPSAIKGSGVRLLNYEEATDIKIMFQKDLVIMLQYNILPQKELITRFLNNTRMDERESWFNKNSVVSEMGKQFKGLIEFAKANMDTKKRGFVIGLSDMHSNYIDVKAQKGGRILSNQFQFPETPAKIVNVESTYNSLKMSIKRPTEVNQWVTKFVVKYWKFAREETVCEKTYSFNNGSTTSIEIGDLSSNEVYQLQVAYVTVMGKSPYGSISNPFVTRPCSTPTELKVTDTTATSLVVQWSAPAHCGRGVKITGYNVTLEGMLTFCTYSLLKTKC